MKSNLSYVLFLAGTLALPVAGYTASEGESTTAKAKDFVDDATITTKIKADFAKDKQVSAMKIHVDTDHGVVKLSGKAKSQTEADLAESIAKGVKGVASVHNAITVSPM